MILDDAGFEIFDHSGLFLIAGPIVSRGERLRIGLSAGHIQGGLVALGCGIRPALFRLEPPSGFGLLFVLSRLFLLPFLKGRSRFFRHGVTPPRLAGRWVLGPVVHAPRHKPAARWGRGLLPPLALSRAPSPALPRFELYPSPLAPVALARVPQRRTPLPHPEQREHGAHVENDVDGHQRGHAHRPRREVCAGAHPVRPFRGPLLGNGYRRSAHDITCVGQSPVGPLMCKARTCL